MKYTRINKCESNDLDEGKEKKGRRNIALNDNVAVDIGIIIKWLVLVYT